MEIQSNGYESFQQVYKEVFPVLMRVAYHVTYNMDASEDVCQEAFIRFYNRNLSFPSIDEAKYWLIRVTKNLSINYVKRKGREQVAVERIKKQPKPVHETGEDTVLEQEACLRVREAIQMLPEKLRAVLVLKEYSDLNYKEIATILNISESNVKVRVHRARQQLEQLLNQEEIHVSR
ncbi:MAG: RNA polymerase sigma factor [Spirochaetia bacterium]|jgi:RNA polymerase sigma-70 factor, ECF subfamily|nr:RNA polymerase sigma factor [Spirochaetia bacterium]MCF7941779.1 RNA polymerase sigma factor [Spirochaetia bacterium]